MTRRAFTAAGALRAPGANERIRVGFIGLGARGDRLLDIFLACGAGAAALCDVYAPHLEFAAKKAAGAPRFTDYRRVLDDSSIDAVVIATPDHWHAIQFLDACQAGKDVYVEKPLSLTIAEGDKMADAARRSGRVVQVGTQRRSSPMIREAVELVRSGAIGHVTAARAFDNLNEWPHGIGRLPDGPPPPGLDWDAWLGPAPLVPYNGNRAWYNYRWFRDYSGGQLANNGIHYIDVIRWAMGLGAPTRVAAMGGLYALDDGREIPDTLEVLWDFGAKTLLSFTQYNANDAPSGAPGADIEFRGTKGTLYVYPDRFEAVPQHAGASARYRPSPLDRSRTRASWIASRKPAMEPRAGKGAASADAEHVSDFLECVKSRRECNAGVLEGHRSTAACLMGNIALRTGTLLHWNEAAGRFTNSPEANRLLDYEYRAPYAPRRGRL